MLMVKNRSPPNSFRFRKENRFENTTNWYRSLFQTVDLFFFIPFKAKKSLFCGLSSEGEIISPSQKEE